MDGIPVVRETNNIMINGTSFWDIQNSSGTLTFIHNSTTGDSLSGGGVLTWNDSPSLNLLSNISTLQHIGTNWINTRNL